MCGLARFARPSLLVQLLVHVYVRLQRPITNFGGEEKGKLAPSCSHALFFLLGNFILVVFFGFSVFDDRYSLEELGGRGKEDERI